MSKTTQQSAGKKIREVQSSNRVRRRRKQEEKAKEEKEREEEKRTRRFFVATKILDLLLGLLSFGRGRK